MKTYLIFLIVILLFYATKQEGGSESPTNEGGNTPNNQGGSPNSVESETSGSSLFLHLRTIDLSNFILFSIV